VPLVGCAPLHPPDAVQLCALLASHFSVTCSPATTVLGFNCSVTEGSASATLAGGGNSGAQAASAAIAAQPRMPHAARGANEAIHPAWRLDVMIEDLPNRHATHAEPLVLRGG
jgi:hypothetical protein